MMTQKERVLDRLQSWHAVCSTTLLEMHIPRGAARICELREQGYDIVTERCDNPMHSHRTGQVQYRIVETRLFN